MTNKVYCPIKETPSFEELIQIILEGFNNLQLPTNQLIVGVLAKPTGLDLQKTFIYVNELYKHLFCWVSFSYFAPELRRDEQMDLPVMAGVQTRGEKDQHFANILAYILAKKLGRIIYDDSHLIQKKDIYGVHELEPFIHIAIKEIYTGGEMDKLVYGYDVNL